PAHHVGRVGHLLSFSLPPYGHFHAGSHGSLISVMRDCTPKPQGQIIGYYPTPFDLYWLSTEKARLILLLDELIYPGGYKRTFDNYPLYPFYIARYGERLRV